MIKYCVMIATVVALTQALHYGDGGIDVKINVEKNSNSYLSGRLPQGSFEYGLNVDKQKDNHFQHKVKGPDDVTYGCYGFVDPDGKAHLVHYVSDLKGYRIVPPDSATKIYVARLESSINNVYEAQEKNVQWKDLFFPPACKQSLTDLDEYTTPEPATTPSPPPPTPSPSREPEPTTSTTTRRPFMPKNPVTPTPSPPTPASPPPSREPEPTTSTTTRRPYVPKQPVTPRPSPQVPPPNTIVSDPEPKPSDRCSSVVNPPSAEPQPACSKVCDDLKDELEDIKTKLQTLLDTLAEKPKNEAGGNGAKFAYFPVMLSDGLPDGVDASSAKFAFPAVPQQCGNQ